MSVLRIDISVDDGLTIRGIRNSLLTIESEFTSRRLGSKGHNRVRSRFFTAAVRA